MTFAEISKSLSNLSVEEREALAEKLERMKQFEHAKRISDEVKKGEREVFEDDLFDRLLETYAEDAA